MTTHLESDLPTFNLTTLLKQLNDGPFLKEITRGYQLDLQCTRSLENLISQEEFQPEELNQYTAQSAGEWSFRDKVHKVIKELVTVKNYYFNILTQTLSLMQKQEQRIKSKSILLELHNLLNGHKDSQINTLKQIIKALGFDPESKVIPPTSDIQEFQARADTVAKEDIMAKIQLCNTLELPKREPQKHDSHINKRPLQQQSKSKSIHKRTGSLSTKETMSLRQASNTTKKASTITNIKSRENSIEQKRHCDVKRDTVLSQELLSITQRYKGTTPAFRRIVTENAPTGHVKSASSLGQDLKKILANKKTQKSPSKTTGNTPTMQQRAQINQSRKDAFEHLIDNVRIEPQELPKGIKLVSENRDNPSRLNSRRSTENQNVDYPCADKIPFSQRSASLSRSPDSTPNMTPRGSRVHTAEEMAVLNRKILIDVHALQKGLKKSCKKLMRKRNSKVNYENPPQLEDVKSDYQSNKEAPIVALKEEQPRQRRSKSIGGVPSSLGEADETVELEIKNELVNQEHSNNSKEIETKCSPIKEMTPEVFMQKHIESTRINYNSQSSIAGSLLRDINSISYCNQLEAASVPKDQENEIKEQSIPASKKPLTQIFGLKDLSRTFNSKENLSAKGGSAYRGEIKQIHTERCERQDEEDYEVFQRRKSVGRRESHDVMKLEVMYGTKTLRRVKNWAPLLPKKN